MQHRPASSEKESFSWQPSPCVGRDGSRVQDDVLLLGKGDKKGKPAPSTFRRTPPGLSSARAQLAWHAHALSREDGRGSAPP